MKTEDVGSQSIELFGRHVQVEYPLHMSEIVSGTLRGYPRVGQVAVGSSKVTLCESLPDIDALASNPPTNRVGSGFIGMAFADATVQWNLTESEMIGARVAMHGRTSARSSAFRRMRHMEYPNPVERLEQVLHELVFIPQAILEGSSFPIHAAGVATENGATLFTGTGGAGKTTAMLTLRSGGRYRFVCDDIAMVNREGEVFENLAWPKIYGYNLGNGISWSELMAGRSNVDRLHFRIHGLRGPGRVRRKIAPSDLFASTVSGGTALSRVVFLSRERIDEPSFAPLPLRVAVPSIVNVIEAEYRVLWDHIRYAGYSSSMLGLPANIALERLLERLESGISDALRSVDTFKLGLPLSFTQRDVAGLFHRRADELVG